MLLVGVSTSVVQVAYAQNSSIDTERENIIIFSRQGEAQLNQAIPKLGPYLRGQTILKCAMI